MSKLEMVQQHIEKHGSISKVQASLLHIGNVNHCISVLRKRGHVINTVTKTNLAGEQYTAWEAS